MTEACRADGRVALLEAVPRDRARVVDSHCVVGGECSSVDELLISFGFGEFGGHFRIEGSYAEELPAFL